MLLSKSGFLVFLLCCGVFTEDVHLFSDIQERFIEATCWSFCRDQNFTSCQSARCDCSTLNIDVPIVPTNISTLSTPIITCKDYNLANLIWEQDDDDLAYFLEIWSDDQEGRNFTEVTTCTSYLLTNLEEDKIYKLRLWGVSYRSNTFQYSDEVSLKTLENNSMPLPVSQISLTSLKLNDDDKYKAVIKWTPSEDLFCYYDLLWFGGDEMSEYDQREIRNPSNLHETIIDNLEFETNYSISIRAIRPGTYQESVPKDLYVITPSCIESFHSLTHCHPPPPENMVVHEKLVDQINTTLLYDVTLTWTKPELIPDYYIAQLRNIYPENQSNTSSMEIPGTETSAIFKNIDLGIHYQVALTAFSLVGPSETVIQERHLTSTYSPIILSNNSWTIPELVLVIVGPISAICLLIILMVLFSHYKGKHKRKEERCKYFKGLEEKSPEGSDGIVVDLIDVDGPDEWELDPNKLFLQTVLGEGAFGVVRRAYLEDDDGNRSEVAIKMLKDCPSPEEVRQFTHEIEIMKSVKKHPHVVSLIGCITRDRPDGPLLVVEYCSRGDLQTYLRTVWDHLTNRQSELQYLDENISSSDKYFANRTYDIQNIESEEFFIQPKQLISIALQVAMGMEHLARTRVVHRDLAARNVLICEDRTVKVSDFGLSRDVYQDNVYCKTGGGKLPIRWMALESLTHQRYTTQSDVWSFGVLLWEIVTIGGTPYAGVHSRDLLVLLKNGYRLERPTNCSTELYMIMQNCWKASPKDRPNFTELRQSLENLLESISHYLHLDVNADYLHLDDGNTNERSQSPEPYIKPTNNCR